MKRQLLLHKFLKTELKRYRDLENTLRELYPILPSGSIAVRGGGRLSRVFRENGKQIRIALNGNDDEILEGLKTRQHVKKALPVISKKVAIYEKLLQEDVLYDPIKIKLELPEKYRNLKKDDLLLEGDVDPEKWAQEDYIHNSLYQDKLVHSTENGIRTRSKSEAMIGSQLERRGLTYRYEPELLLGNKRVYPDFVILHPKDRGVIIWEHFGMVDDPAYMLHNLQKLEEYAKHGYLLGVNLFITYETREQPLTIAMINKKIDEILNL